MNKTEFINTLSKELSYSHEKCILINDILEHNFFIGKKHKNKIIEELIQALKVDYEDALKIYDVSVKIINDELKNKLNHPFKNKTKSYL